MSNHSLNHKKIIIEVKIYYSRRTLLDKVGSKIVDFGLFLIKKSGMKVMQRMYFKK